MRAYARRLTLAYPRQLGLALALHGLAAIAGLAAPRLLGELVEDVRRGTSHVAVDRIALAIAAFVLAQGVLLRFAVYASARLGEKVLARLREEFVDRVLELPLSTVERAGTGDLITRTTRDVDILSRSVRHAVPETLIAIVTGMFAIGALVLVGPADRAAVPDRRAAAVGRHQVVPQARARRGYLLGERRVGRRSRPGSPRRWRARARSRRCGWRNAVSHAPTPTSRGAGRPSATRWACGPCGFRWSRWAT